MPIPDDIQEHIPGHFHRKVDVTTLYWIRDGKVMCGHDPVPGADPETFRFYRGGFAKDRKNCYSGRSKLKGGNGSTFRALNFTYATDGAHVWTIAGEVKDADAASFVVCDDGVGYTSGGSRVPHGFGKDKDRVFYYDFDGKPNWVRKASPASFVSLNDGYYGKDAEYVFCGAATIPKADVEKWHRIGGHYSKDGRRVFYFNREMRGVDYDSFEVVPVPLQFQLARDKDHLYNNDRVIDENQFNELIALSGANAQPGSR
jgi:hypothetical protein